MPVYGPPAFVTLDGNTSGALALVSTGTLTLAGGDNITLSQAGNAITISGAAGGTGGGGSFSAGISTGGNTSGTSGVVSGRLVLAGGNNITLSQSVNGGSATVSVSAFNQSEQSQSRFNLTLAGNTAGALALISSGVMTLAGGNNITVSQAGNAVTVSAANETQTVPPIATAVKGVSSIGSTGTITRFAPEDHQHAGVFSMGVSNVGNTSGQTTVIPGQFVLAGGNNITVSQGTAAGNLVTVTISAANSGTAPPIATAVNSVASANSTGTITRFAPEDHRHEGLYKIDVGGNTAGNTSAGGGSLQLAGGPNITVSGATAAGGMTLSFSGGAGGAAGSNTFGASNLGNTSGTSGVISGSALQFVLAGGNNITLSQSINASSVTITISAGAGAAATVSRFIYPSDDMASISSHSQGSFLIQRIQVPCYVSASKMLYYMSVSVASAANTSSAYFDMSHWLGIYTRNASTLNSVSSTSFSFTTFVQSNTIGGVTGLRGMEIPINVNMSPGDYYVGLGLSSTNSATGGANTTAIGWSYTLYGGQNLATAGQHFVPFGVSTTASRNWFSGVGLLSVTTNGVPTAISLSDIVQSGTNVARANIVVDFKNVD